MKGKKFINLFTDFGFKRVFGQEANKDLLIDFLNQVLPPDYKIENLSYSKNEYTGATELDRKAIFDLHCISTKKERFIVELQKAKQKFFKDRSLFYATFPITEQAPTGDWNFKLHPVFMVGILNFSFDDSDPNELRHHVMLKDQRGKVFYEKLHFLYLEIQKFNKKLDDCKSRFEKWLWIFKYLPELNEIPEKLVDEMFSKVFKISEVAKLSPTEKDDYERSLKYFRDLNNVVDSAYEDGLTAGRLLADSEIERERKLKEEALSKEKEANKKLALKMLKYGESISDIIAETGLSKVEIQSLL